MIRRIVFVISLLACMLPFYLGAQTKSFTIDDAVVGVWREYYPEMIYGLQIRPDTKTCTKWDGRDFVEFSFDKKKSSVLFTLGDLVSEMKANGIEPSRSYPGYKWLNKNEIEVSVGNSVCVFDVAKKKIKSAAKCDDDVENATYCSANSSFAYTVDNNLLVRTGDKVMKVSDEKDSNIVYGQTVHRNEFGIDGGIFWSPNGNYLAFYRKDNSKVSDYPIVDVNERVAKMVPEKYCMAGMDSEEVTVGVFDMKTQKIVYLDVEGPKDQFLTMVTWSPDEKSIYVGVLNREQNHLQMRRYNASTGKFEKLLFEEKNDRYVEPQHPLTFLPNDPEKFIYWSRKDGFWHLYLYNIDGKQISQITKGDFEVQEIYGFANKNQDLIINANKETPIDFTIYKVNIASGNMTLISGNSGKHDAILSNDGEYFVDSYESTTVPREYVLYQTSTGKKVSTLLTAENPLADFKMPTLKIGTLK
ncbi:MAG: DPP IV N-terminal domain-containing protein, partial [Bacteroidales bacterium]|nr:DPP IV N-terminal domain-containing protein [Bacteroidales bacterium]